MEPSGAVSLHAIGFDVARVALWLLILSALFIPVERLFAGRRQPVFRPQIGADLAHYFLNSVVTVAILTSLLGLLAVLIYRMEPQAFHALMADLPLWARIPATMIAGELGFYWGHRWAHQTPLLWRFHAIHHSAVEVDWLTNTRAHPVDMLLPRLCGFTLIYAAGLAQTDSGAGGMIVPSIAVLTILWGFFIHANVKWRFGWLEWVIATPAFHRWHHVSGEHQDMNYAAMLPVFDYLFGTLHLPPRELPEACGCDTPVPATWSGQMISPFVP
jgi:sterol desaturase/sphingolipid hydroxylase (fatty acid hydroxylase superfamily)